VPNSIRKEEARNGKDDQRVIDMLKDPQTSKVVATCDDAGKLNVVPKGTITALDEETIAYCDIFGDKTNLNLEANQKAAVAVFKMDLPPIGYQVKGKFQGFQTSGPMFDTFAKQIKDQLNLDIKAVGVIKVDEVYSAGVPNPGAKLA
jgi:predicted pyridoxine 5'-phosphate oxidase superfamily flavin-nucleotide-binding protein